MEAVIDSLTRAFSANAEKLKIKEKELGEIMNGLQKYFAPMANYSEKLRKLGINLGLQ
jgi:hypothetical protein